MVHWRSHERRSGAEWAVRTMLAVVALALGYVGAAQALGYAFRDDAARAQVLSPWNGRITALLARQLSSPKATLADQARAVRLARLSLRQDPTAVTAVSTLGLITQSRGNVPGARRLFAYAEKLSRRDLPTQLWAIEDAVGRGDVQGALRHYDIALRTSRNAPVLLYPILASAIADPSVRGALLRTLAAQPEWGESFVNYVASNGADIQATAILFDGLRRARISVAAQASAVVINGLILGNHWRQAWFYYASIRTGADRRRSRDPRFQALVATPSPFDWAPADDPAITAAIQRGKDGGTFVFAAPSSVGGSLLVQAQVLPPGEYRLVGRSSGLDQPEVSRPYWSLTCRDGRELGRLTLPNSELASGQFAGRLRVPAGCPVQILALIARPSDSVSGVSGQIDAVQLAPLD